MMKKDVQSSFHEERRYRRNPRVRVKLLTRNDVSGAVLITQTDLALDDTGLRLWNWLREPCTPEQLSSKLRRELG